MKEMMENLKRFRKGCSLQNLKRNWYFPLSAGAFFCLNIRITRGSAFALAVALAAVCLIAARLPSLWAYVKAGRGLTAFSVLSAAGICLGAMDSFAFEDMFNQGDKIRNLLNRSPWVDIGIDLCGAASLVFISFFVLLFWKRFRGLMKWKRDLLALSGAEKILYAGLAVLLCGYVIYAFTGSVVFYDVHAYDFVYDAIYSSDSTELFRPSAYLWPAHAENDIRQPLFALFSAPFMGIPYLIGSLISVPVKAILMDCVQVLMLLFANLMIAKSMRLGSGGRICFMGLSFCMYSNLLFTVMMEQYIVVYFWLASAVYMFCSGEEYDELPLLAAGGTLLAGFALLPFFPPKGFTFSKPGLKAWLIRVGKLMAVFLFLMAVFCKFDLFYNLVSLSRFMMTFTGKNITFTDRLYQFSEFVRGCFLAPHAGVDFTTKKHVAWFLNPALGIHPTGAVILGLALLSALIHRRKKACLLSGAWVVLSFLVLAVVGWGTKENGLILYALYFGWAYLVLLLQLVFTVCEKLRIGAAAWVICGAACTGMLVFNLPAIGDLLRFAYEYYPL